jgi:hypothetical protein
MGYMESALDAVMTCWGGQIELGATTFWEVYSPEWNSFIEKNGPVPNGQNSFTSLCHPWAGMIHIHLHISFRYCFLVIFSLTFAFAFFAFAFLLSLFRFRFFAFAFSLSLFRFRFFAFAF